MEYMQTMGMQKVKQELWALKYDIEVQSKALILGIITKGLDKVIAECGPMCLGNNAGRLYP